jgi:hypothetical protein
MLLVTQSHSIQRLEDSMASTYAVALNSEARRLDGIYLTTAPHSLPPLDGTDKTFLPVA